MMLPILLLAAAGRCVSPDLCPTDEQLITALREEDNATLFAIQAQSAAENPDSIVHVSMRRITGISRVTCTNPLPDRPQSIRCSFVLHRHGKSERQSAVFTRTENEWAYDG